MTESDTVHISTSEQTTSIPTVSTENSELSTSKEIPSEKIAESANRIGTALNVEERRIAATGTATGKIVTKEEMTQEIHESIVRNHRAKLLHDLNATEEELQEDSAENQILRKLIDDEVKKVADYLETYQDKRTGIEVQGRCLPERNGRHKILIRDDVSEDDFSDFLDHEIVHALGIDPESFDSGFSGDVSGYNTVNEAATDLLRLAAKYPDLSAIELFKRIKEMNLKSYNNGTKLLITGLAATHMQGGTPVSLQDLSDHYMGNRGKTGSKAGLQFMSELANGLPENYKGIIDPLLNGKI